jgi:predicted nicotinamide N-methyase
MGLYKKHPASYRDPSGFVFERDGIYYRQVNKLYAADYEWLIKSGLYDLLVKEKKLLPHIEVEENLTGEENWYRTLLPEQLHFISYPYEWCFSQWKDAALLTLELVQKALEHDMILKDATPFNIQFVNGAPLLIDSLSFEKYDETMPWIAYHQFAECFIAPLLLARYQSADTLKMFQLYPDGIPLRFVSKLLPFKSLFNLNVWLHIRLPNMLSAAGDNKQKKSPVFSRQKMKHLISNLYSFVQSLSLPRVRTQWNNYYDETILSGEYASAKKKIIEDWLHELPGKTVLDIGTNTGLFAHSAASAGKYTIAIDADIACIDKLYYDCRKKKINNLTPLCSDIVNPAPGIGWQNEERTTFLERARPDIIMALALVHHLVIGRDVSFDQMSDMFSSLTPWLIVEFVPLLDPRTQLLVVKKTKNFDWYTESLFLEVFQQRFKMVEKSVVKGTARTLFLMQRL